MLSEEELFLLNLQQSTSTNSNLNNFDQIYYNSEQNINNLVESIPSHLLDSTSTSNTSTIPLTFNNNNNQNNNQNNSNLFQNYSLNHLQQPQHRLSEDQLIKELNYTLTNNNNNNNNTNTLPIDFTNLSQNSFNYENNFGFDYYDQSSTYSGSGQYTPSYADSSFSETSSIPPSSNYSPSPYLNPVEDSNSSEYINNIGEHSFLDLNDSYNMENDASGIIKQENDIGMDFIDSNQSGGESSQMDTITARTRSRHSFSHLMNNLLPQDDDLNQQQRQLYAETLTDSPPNSIISLPNLSHPSKRASPPLLAPLNIPTPLGNRSGNVGELGGPSLNLIEPTPSTARPRRRGKGQGTLDLENLLGVLVHQETYSDIESDPHSEHNINFNSYDYPLAIPTSSERETLLLGGDRTSSQGSNHNHSQSIEQSYSHSHPNSIHNSPSIQSSQLPSDPFTYNSPLPLPLSQPHSQSNFLSLSLPRPAPNRQRSKSDSSLRPFPSPIESTFSHQQQLPSQSQSQQQPQVFDVLGNNSESGGYQLGYNFPYAHPTPSMIVKNQEEMIERSRRESESIRIKQEEEGRSLLYLLDGGGIQASNNNSNETNFYNDRGGPGYSMGLNVPSNNLNSIQQNQGGVTRHRRTQSHGINMNRRPSTATSDQNGRPLTGDSNHLNIPQISSRPRSSGGGSNRSRSPSPSGSNRSRSPSPFEVLQQHQLEQQQQMLLQQQHQQQQLYQFQQEQQQQQQIQQQQQQQFQNMPLYGNNNNGNPIGFAPPPLAGSYYLTATQQQQQQQLQQQQLQNPYFYSSPNDQNQPLPLPIPISYPYTSPSTTSNSSLPPLASTSKLESTSSTLKVPTNKTKVKPKTTSKKSKMERDSSPNSEFGGEISLESKTTAATIEAALKRRAPGSEAKFQCSLCGETFTRRYNLKGHERAHRNEKPFECSYDGCEKAFARAHDKKRHELLHLGVRKYNCNPCGRDFVRLDALQRHHRTEVGQSCVNTLRAAGVVIGYDTTVETTKGSGELL